MFLKLKYIVIRHKGEGAVWFGGWVLIGSFVACNVVATAPS